MRIIGGAWRSRVIHFAARKDLRPTPDRVRETLFNWLGQDLTGAICLDLFAGSGALGFEAASRGAQRVVMVERDPATFRALERTRAALDAGVVELCRADALKFLHGDSGRYDVVFLDPPFRDANWPRLLALLPGRMSRGAFIYCESAAAPTLPTGWDIWKRGAAGQVCFQLLKRTEQ